jgi:hypothetical protein
MDNHSTKIGLAVFLSITILILTFLSSRFNEFIWIVTGIGLVIGIAQWLVPVPQGKPRGFLTGKLKDFLKKRKFAIYLTILGLIMLGNILLLLGKYTGIPSVTITSPAGRSTVPKVITVQGTASNIPPGKELWLLVEAEGAGSYFPQGDADNPSPIVVSSGGTWSITAYIGQQAGSADVGREFVLYPALIDQNDTKAKDAIQTYFKQRGPVYEGIPLGGIQLMSPVSIIRTE